MQYKPSKWVSGYKHGPAASYTQITRMGLFLNVATSKFEPLDSTWDNLHSGGMFISDDNKIYFRDETNKDIYINSPADNQLALYASSGVGVNVTPTEMLHVVDATAEGGVLIDNTATDGNPILAFGLSGTKTFTMGIDDGDSDQFKIFSGAAIDGTSEFVIDGSGNVGIGTSSIPDHVSTVSAVQIGQRSSLWSETTGNAYFQLANNAYYDNTNSRFEYVAAGTASKITQQGGSFQFSSAASGSADAAITFTDLLTISAAGEITAPLQPAFNAYVAATQSNIAINTEVVVQYNTDSGLGYDQGGDYNTTTYTFTAPVDGRYLFTYFMRLSSVDSAVPQLYTVIVTSNANYEQVINPDTMFSSDVGTHTANNSTMADMDASDTAFIRIYQAGGTAQMDITGNTYSAYFSGTLIC